jgi:demethylmenaquinone methyltransferase / 2-methoxy-6-polyprenyl-1,4-benzoquinol methylase
MSDNPATTVDFGFRRVDAAEKTGMVRAVFDSVAPRYDLMNDLMSLGIHRVWKQIFVTDLHPRPTHRLLDLAGGTGDITFRWLKRGGGPALLTDINRSMLSIGRDRAINDGFAGEVSLVVAFGLRNCTDKPAVLREARRVLRPGGRFLCLEFSKLAVYPLMRLYDAWSFTVLPRLGRMVAGDEASYRYLAESIRTFPDQEALAAMMREAGLVRINVRNLSAGIAAIHSGWRL